jgi:four helix bundle protein
MARAAFEKLEVYRLSEKLADEVWKMVMGWKGIARDTVGKQLVRAVDGIGANIAEGVGRGSFQDNRRFVKIGRGSLYEVIHWLRRAYVRELVSKKQTDIIQPLIAELSPRLNAYLKSIGSHSTNNNGPLTTDH